MSIKLYRHGDLDGVACEVIFRRTFSNKEIEAVFPTNYDTIDQLLNDRLDNKNDSTDIWVLDICPSKETCERLNDAYKAGLNVILIDHHENREFLKRYPWATLDTIHCAAYLTLEELGQPNQEDRQEVLNFVQAVEAWDMWFLKSAHRQRGEDLNRILHFIGDKRFLEACGLDIAADKNSAFLSTIKNILKEKEDTAVARVIKEQLHTSPYYIDSLNRSFKILFASEYHSQVGNAALNDPDSEDLRYIVVVNPIRNICSLRSRTTEEIDVSKIALCFGGGGHKQAAGFFTDMKSKATNEIAGMLQEAPIPIASP